MVLQTPAQASILHFRLIESVCYFGSEKNQIYAELAAARTKCDEAKQVEKINWQKRKKEIKELKVKERFLGSLVEADALAKRCALLNRTSLSLCFVLENFVQVWGAHLPRQED